MISEGNNKGILLKHKHIYLHLIFVFILCNSFKMLTMEISGCEFIRDVYFVTTSGHSNISTIKCICYITKTRDL